MECVLHGFNNIVCFALCNVNPVPNQEQSHRCVLVDCALYNPRGVALHGNSEELEHSRYSINTFEMSEWIVSYVPVYRK
jgi:hypothetical protein